MSKVVLFQGDSITDAGWDKNGGIHLGYGYATMVKGALGAEYPYDYTFYNRGISGNRIVDLYARMKMDMINLKPDYMSILVGVNGVWHECSHHNGVDAEKFERVYDMLLTELKEELPDLKLMLLEPFFLPGTATQDVPECPNRLAYYTEQMPLRQAAVARLAEKHGAVFVPLQDLFNKVNEGAPEGYWLRDGVHPTAAGHELIKKEWLKAFEQLK